MQKIWPWACCTQAAPCEVHTSATERTVYLADPLRAQLRKRAKTLRVPLRALVILALERYLDGKAA